ncbi:hypothetical protein TW65_00972 [Stemphylium lycopersici]|nr:hypothetical protein TW65_00972 [Stemphylium lycopersici]
MTDLVHHCSQGGNHARANECVTRDSHQNYCPCWEYDETNGWYRCGQQHLVMSVGCTKHRDDEMRKVFDKIRKQYPTYGWELNLRDTTPPQEPTKTKTEVIEEDARVEEEEIERQLQESGEIDDSVFVFSKVKQREEEQERSEYYRRKDTKEFLRIQKSAAPRINSMTRNGAERAGGKYTVQFAQESVRDGKEKKFIPALEEKAKNGVQSKAGNRVWNRGKKDIKQQASGGADKENESSKAGTSQNGQPISNGPEKNSRMDRVAVKFGINQKNKEKTRGGKKKD